MKSYRERSVELFLFLETYGFVLERADFGREPQLEFNRGYETICVELGINPGVKIYAPASQFDGLSESWAEKDGIQRGFRRLQFEFDDKENDLKQMADQLLDKEKGWLESHLTKQ
jgi:hypothetical protein